MTQTIRNKKLSRRHLTKSNTNIQNARIGNGLTKRYRKYSIKQDGSGLFGFIRLKWKMRDVNKIIGKLNTLEKNMNKEIDSYETKAKRFENLAKEKAEYQTKYIIAFRNKIIYDVYISDKAEVDKQDAIRKKQLETTIKDLNMAVQNARIGAAEKDKILGSYIKEYLRLTAKFQKELDEFNKIAKLKNKIEAFQNEIKDLQDAANLLEGKSNISKEDKAKARKYKSNEADYKRILSVSHDTLEAVKKIQQKSGDIISTAIYYKNQFGTYKKESKSIEGKKTKGALDIDYDKAEAKLEKWTKDITIFSNDLMQINNGIKQIQDQLTNIGKWVEVCVNNLVTVWISWRDKPESQAILWFQKNIADTLDAVKKIKIYFLKMKEDFYNMVPAKNMFINYDRNVRFLNFIENNLKDYTYVVGKALKNFDDLKAKQAQKLAGGGWFNMIGGVHGHVHGHKPPKNPQDMCYHLVNPIKNSDIYAYKKIEHIFKPSENVDNFKKSGDGCYNKYQNEFKTCIENFIELYLLGAYFLHDIITDFNNSDYKTSIEELFKVHKIVEKLPWDKDTKKLIQKKFDNNNIKKMDLSSIGILKNNNVNGKKISEIFNSAGLIVPANADIQTFQNYVSSKPYLYDFIKAAMADLGASPNNKVYGIMKYDSTQTSALKTHLDSVLNAYDPVADLAAITGAATPVAGAAAQAGPPNPQQVSQKSKVLITDPNEFPQKLRELKDMIQGGHNYTIHYNYPIIIDELDNIYKLMKSLIDKNPDVNIPNINIYNDKLNDIITNKYTGLSNDKMLSIKQELQKFKLFSVQPLDIFYDRVLSNTEDKDKAKAAMIDLANKLKVDNNNPSATMVDPSAIMVDILAANPQYNPVLMPNPSGAHTATAVINTAAAQQTTGLIPAASAASAALATIPKIETEEEKKKREEEEKKAGQPEHWNEKDRIQKLNADLIAHIIVRIPNNYEVQRETVYTHFAKIRSALEKLSDNNIIHKLSNHLMRMTDKLVDIKSIESSIIDIRVAEYTKPIKGIASWILDPINSELKSEAASMGDKVEDLVKTIMTNKLYVNEDYKENKEEVQKLYDKLLGQCHNNPISLNLDEKKLLGNKNNLYILLNKILEYAKSTGAVATNTDKDKTGMKKLLCNMIKSFEWVADKKEDEVKIEEVKNSIQHKCYFQSEKKDKDKKRDGKRN